MQYRKRTYPILPKRPEDRKRKKREPRDYKSLKPRDVYTPGTCVKEYRPNVGTPTDTTYTSGYPSFRETVTAGTIVQGNFRDPNSWSYDILKRRQWHGIRKDVSSYGSGSTTWWKGALTGDWITGPAWQQTSVYNMALERLNNQVRGGLDLGVALAEIHSTKRMIKAVGDVRHYASGRWSSSSVGSSKDVANGWLQWQYGWKPLMSDIFGIADESIRVVINRLERVRGRAKLPITDDNPRFKRTVQTQQPFVVRKGEGVQACTISIVYEVPQFDLARWSSLNPVSLAWELIPFSFVADWFFDVGSYLRAMETATLYCLRFQSGYVSELYAWNGVEDVDPTWKNVVTTTTYTFPYASSTVRERHFRRTKLTSYPLPRLPSFQTDLSSTRLLSAAALLRQLGPGDTRILKKFGRLGKLAAGLLK